MASNLRVKCLLESNDGREKQFRRFSLESAADLSFTYSKLKEKVYVTYPELMSEDSVTFYYIGIQFYHELVDIHFSSNRMNFEMFR